MPYYSSQGMSIRVLSRTMFKVPAPKPALELYFTDRNLPALIFLRSINDLLLCMYFSGRFSILFMPDFLV